MLVLDEPTASLPAAEVDAPAVGALRRYAEAGQTILFVSHRLDEVVGFADQATVLRDGQVAGTLTGDEITENRLIELIAGRALDRLFPDMPEVVSDEHVIEVVPPRRAGRCATSASGSARARCSASPACSARVGPSC